MGLRYLIEACFFIMLMFVFLYEVSLFNRDLHISFSEVGQFKAFERELERRNENTYRDLSALSVNEEELDRLLSGDVETQKIEEV